MDSSKEDGDPEGSTTQLAVMGEDWTPHTAAGIGRQSWEVAG